MPNGRNSGNGKEAKLKPYDKGYRDGYMEGLSECGPLAGFTQWFSRRAKTKKLGQMKEAERRAVVAEAIAQYESEAKGAKERLLANPKRKEHIAIAKDRLRSAKLELQAAKKSRARESRFEHAIQAFNLSTQGVAHAPSIWQETDRKLLHALLNVQAEAMKILATLADVKRTPVLNPSEAGAAALGGVAGGLLLGPIGAAAGGYTGVKLKKRAEGKKAARTRARRKAGRKKNPQVGRLMRDALK